MPQSTTLTAAQRAALDALAQGHSISGAAQVAGVDRSTIHRWMRKRGAFTDAMMEATTASLKVAAIRLMGMTGAAADALMEVMTSTGEPGAAVRLRAADSVLGHAVKLMEVAAFEQRITDLEARLKELS